jgi:hypothetical protein
MTKGKPWVYRTAWGSTLPTSKKAFSTAVCYGNVIQFNVPGRVFGFRIYSQSINNLFGGIFWITRGGAVGSIGRALEFGNRYALTRSGAGDHWYNRYLRSALRIDVNVPYQICFMQNLPGNQISYTPSVMTADIVGTYITSIRNFTGSSYPVNNGVGSSSNPWRTSVNDSDSRYGIDVLFLEDGQA